jgi:hypothetical protein
MAPDIDPSEPFDDSKVDSPREREDSAAVHGDSQDELDEDHDVTNPSNAAPEQDVNDLLGGNFPLR